MTADPRDLCGNWASCIAQPYTPSRTPSVSTPLPIGYGLQRQGVYER